MQAVAAYNANHPEYSTRMICEAANVRHTTHLGFLAVGQNGNNGRQAHREDLEPAIRKFAATLTSDPSVHETVKGLSSQGVTCSPAIVSDILNEMGYATSIRNTNASRSLYREAQHKPLKHKTRCQQATGQLFSGRKFGGPWRIPTHHIPGHGSSACHDRQLRILTAPPIWRRVDSRTRDMSHFCPRSGVIMIFIGKFAADSQRHSTPLKLFSAAVFSGLRV